ncbi:MAG: molecular chaperone DnaJ [Thalassospira sp.]|nr:molecular chaperone DnaJ [Thalassospira sp.]
MSKDYYQTLGVSKSADAAALKGAYRKLAMQYHPDKNPGDKAAESKFKEVSEAYDVLRDEQKRAAYDRYGHAAFTQQGGAGFGGGRGGFQQGGFEFSGSFADIFDEVFGEFMGGGRGGSGAGQTQSPQNRGADLRYNMDITLEEAFNGKEATIRVPSLVSCEVCEGSGSEPGSGVVTCPTCNGHGRVRVQQGFFTLERTCHTCSGTGSVIENPCKACHGEGRTRKDRTLEVSIPPGVEDGTRIRLNKEGEAGMRGGQAGDLYIFLNVKPHKLFQREGADLYCRVPIPMATAALGGKLNVAGIDGAKLAVTIPEGTQHGHRVRLKSKGMTLLRSDNRGDMYIDVQIETPVNLTSKQKELLLQFQELSEKHNSSPQSEGFFNKLKDVWKDLTD